MRWFGWSLIVPLFSSRTSSILFREASSTRLSTNLSTLLWTYTMSPIPNHELFSPLDADVSLQTQFSEVSGLISPIDPPNHEQHNTPFCQPRPRAHSIPRKPLPQYTQLKYHGQTNSFSSLSTVNTIKEEELENNSTEKRGWRFYGTFACLALLNFVCALDATILSVALPVRNIIFSAF